MSATLRKGQLVCSSDGQLLGEVKEVGEQEFKVDVRMHPDYWLARDRIATVVGDRVNLDFIAARVGEFVTEPRPSMTGNR